MIHNKSRRTYAKVAVWGAGSGMTKKTLLLGLLALAAAAGQLSAQTFGGFNSRSSFNLVPMKSDSEMLAARTLQTIDALYAGLKNMLGGWWSWKHNDTFGGALTAGLEGGGILLFVIGYSTVRSGGYMAAYAGYGALLGGMLFGYFRGMSQYKKQNPIAAGFSGNPLEHVSFGVVPGGGGSLLYSTKL